MRAADPVMAVSLSPASSADLPGDVATGAAIVASNRRAVFYSVLTMAAAVVPLALAACVPPPTDRATCERQSPPWSTAECRTAAL